MKIVTVNIPEVFIEALERLVKARVIPSRSEAIRQCIQIGLPKLFEQWHVLEALGFYYPVADPIIKQVQEENISTDRRREKIIGNEFHPNQDYTKKEALYIN